MKITATARTSLDSASARHRIGQALSRGVARRLAADLEDELHAVRASGRADDADTRREALARAVRRHFGAAL